MNKIVIHLIAAARPNFMKVAPLYHALKDQDWCKPILVHTGQHYDRGMSDVFFDDLDLPSSDIHLGVGSGTHAEQTGSVMIEYEKVCMSSRPDWVIVVGDVNSTVACTLAAKKLDIPVAHLEAGLRSGDRTMPEEINRIVTDAIADLLWTPSKDADENLRKEGIPESKIALVGNIMIDSYEFLRCKIENLNMIGNLSLRRHQYGVITLHRPSNVDDKHRLSEIVQEIKKIARYVTLIFPAHPRTKQRLQEYNFAEMLENDTNIRMLPSLSYIEFMSLVGDSRFVVTDSGGIQEETTYLNIPCLTLRNTTERPITVSLGTNRLIELDSLQSKVVEAINGQWPKGTIPPLWDGRTASRVVQNLRKRVLDNVDRHAAFGR